MIEAVAVDRRRSVVLIRRDNVEHLFMIGGPTDVLTEPNIIRATGAREPAWPAAPEPSRLAGELSHRLTPAEVALPPAPSEAPRIASPRMEPLAPAEESAPPQQTVHNLEELKRQLEVALRGSPAPQGRPPITDPLAVRPPPTLSASEPKIEPPKPEAESKSKPEPKPEKPPEPEPEPKDEPAEPVGKKISDIL